MKRICDSNAAAADAGSTVELRRLIMAKYHHWSGYRMLFNPANETEQPHGVRPSAVDYHEWTFTLSLFMWLWHTLLVYNFARVTAVIPARH